MRLKGKPTATPHGALAKLWRNVIMEKNLENALGYLVSRYVTKNAVGGKNVQRKTRSTIEADVTASELTWKKFCHLIFHYLEGKRLDITIKVTYANGDTSAHTVGLVATEATISKEPLDIKEDKCTNEKK